MMKRSGARWGRAPDKGGVSAANGGLRFEKFNPPAREKPARHPPCQGGGKARALAGRELPR